MVNLDAAFLDHQVGIPLSCALEHSGEIVGYSMGEDPPAVSVYPDQMVLGVVDGVRLAEVIHLSMVSRGRIAGMPSSTGSRPWFSGGGI